MCNLVWRWIGEGFIMVRSLETIKVKWNESCSVVSNSLWPHGIVHGILQSRTLELVALPLSRGSSQPRDRTGVSCIIGGLFTSWALPGKPPETIALELKIHWLMSVQTSPVHFPQAFLGIGLDFIPVTLDCGEIWAAWLMTFTLKLQLPVRLSL